MTEVKEPAYHRTLGDEELALMKSWRAQGVTNSDIVRNLAERNVKVSRQRISQILGPPTRPEVGPRERFSVYTTPENIRKVKDMARSLNLVHWSGPTSGEGSLSELFNAIATGQLVLKRGKAS